MTTCAALDTVDRLVSAAGYEIDARPRIEFVSVAGARGRVVLVPTRLPRLPAAQALGSVELPLTLNWSQRAVVLFTLARAHHRTPVTTA
jgi:hypothetical protein